MDARISVRKILPTTPCELIRQDEETLILLSENVVIHAVVRSSLSRLC